MDATKDPAPDALDQYRAKRSVERTPEPAGVVQPEALGGRWTLVKIKKEVKEWLLIKERDALARENGDDFPQGSVLSGLTVEDLRDGKNPAAPIVAELQRLEAPRRAVRVRAVELMLAE